nr:MAG TPA: hypothetical protein [Caudoviricetes sp.]
MYPDSSGRNFSVTRKPAYPNVCGEQNQMKTDKRFIPSGLGSIFFILGWCACAGQVG